MWLRAGCGLQHAGCGLQHGACAAARHSRMYALCRGARQAGQTLGCQAAVHRLLPWMHGGWCWDEAWMQGVVSFGSRAA